MHQSFDDNFNCTCIVFIGIEELEGAVAIDCPVHDPPLKPNECECGNLVRNHIREITGCEFHNHHCDYCHDAHICTTESCKLNFKLNIKKFK